MRTLRKIVAGLGLLCLSVANCVAQSDKPSMYGDMAKADVKMNYVYSYEEALAQAKREHKLVFFNCFVDWAVPCHGMNKYVFSDQEFCDFMNKHFVNLWMDMTTREGNELALKYKVKTYAHYLILDADGNVVHRIVGGAKLPDFREQVARALSDKTSLKGTARLYAEGDHSQTNLYNYATALRLASEDSLFTVVGKEYLATIQPADLAKKGNWMFARLAIPDRDSKYYPYLIEHKQMFADSIGAPAINAFIESLVCRDIMRYAMGDVVYDKAALEKLRQVLDRAQLPDTCVSYTLYKVAKFRGEKDYQGLIRYMETDGHYLTIYRSHIEMSLDLPDMSEADKTALVAYLEKAAAREGDTSAGKTLAAFARQLSRGEGIDFEHGPFSEVLARAKREGKLVFMDCYTSWCGPCRMMSSVVFTRKDVGDVFNAHYVSFKCDMEKGEGVELAKKYNVKVYPTMLILDADGQVVYSFTGARSPRDLIAIGKEHAK